MAFVPGHHVGLVAFDLAAKLDLGLPPDDAFTSHFEKGSGTEI